MANFLRLPSVRFPVLLKRFVRPKVSLPRLKPLTFEILGERYGCAPVVRRDARYLSSTRDANNGENTPRSSNNPNMLEANVTNMVQIKADTTYLLWNLACGAILRRDSSNQVVCDGVYTTQGPKSTTCVEFKKTKGNHYKVYFNQKYIMVGNGEGKEITAVLPKEIIPGDDESQSEFKLIHNGIFGMFKLKQNGSANSADLYLGCDYNGYTTLVAMATHSFPTPQALFIFNELQPQVQ